MISKEEAKAIVLKKYPFLFQNKSFLSVHDGYERLTFKWGHSGFDDCWYITYYNYPEAEKKEGKGILLGTFYSRFLAVSKYTGKILIEGDLVGD